MNESCLKFCDNQRGPGLQLLKIGFVSWEGMEDRRNARGNFYGHFLTRPLKGMRAEWKCSHQIKFNVLNTHQRKNIVASRYKTICKHKIILMLVVLADQGQFASLFSILIGHLRDHNISVENHLLAFVGNTSPPDNSIT